MSLIGILASPLLHKVHALGRRVYLGSCASRSADKGRIIEIEATNKVLEGDSGAECPLDGYRHTLLCLRKGSTGHG